MVTPLERFREVVSFKIPDQVPVMPGITDHYSLWLAAANKGVPPESLAKAFYTDYKASFSMQMEVLKSFPEVKTWPGPFPIMAAYAPLSGLGCTFGFPENAPPGVTSHAIQKPEDIEKLKVPDPKKDGLMPGALEAVDYMHKNTPSDLKRNYGYVEGVVLSLGPTDVAGQLMGFDQFNIGLYKTPELILKAMDVVTETVIDWLKAQAEITGGFDFAVIFDDTGSFLNAKQFEKFSLPYLQRVFHAIKRKDNALLLHNDAKCDHILDKLPTIGANLWNYGVDMDTSVIKQKVGKTMCLVGGLAPLKELKRGTAEDVERCCKKAIEQGGPNGGFILSTAGGVAAGTPVRNVKAMIASGEKFGKYPLSI
jgi:uroporphyrinogen decarboxylase